MTNSPDDQRALVSQAADSTPTPRWKRALRRRWVVVIALVLALSAVAIWQAATHSPSADTTALVGRSNQAAPPFSLQNLTEPGRTVTLASFRGRPLVVNFWASWCVPCRTEMPLLERAYRARHGAVAFLGVDANDTPSAAKAFLQQVHVTYETASDDSGTLAARYGLFGLPTTVFISASGKIVGQHIGELHEDTLAAALREAFHD
jgi:cytochrome c biogenesis protein CcmG, thiol:disulfide interchange protein DsbE